MFPFLSRQHAHAGEFYLGSDRETREHGTRRRVLGYLGPNEAWPDEIGPCDRLQRSGRRGSVAVALENDGVDLCRGAVGGVSALARKSAIGAAGRGVGVAAGRRGVGSFGAKGRTVSQKSATFATAWDAACRRLSEKACSGARKREDFWN